MKNQTEHHVYEVKDFDVNLAELTHAKNEYNYEYGADKASHRSDSTENIDVLLRESSPEIQREITEKIIITALQKLRGYFAETFSKTGLDIIEKQRHVIPFIKKPENISFEITVSGIEIVLADGPKFIIFIDSLDELQFSEKPEQIFGLLTILDSFEEQLSSMYTSSPNTKDFQIELVRYLSQIYEALSKFQKIDNLALRNSLKKIKKHNDYLKKGTFMEHVLINKYNLLDETDHFLGGPRTWVEQTAYVEGPEVFKSYKDNWEKAINILITVWENQKARSLYFKLKAHLLECLKSNRLFIEKIHELPNNSEPKDTYHNFIDEKIDFLQSLDKD